jgi:hypothetical protein
MEVKCLEIRDDGTFVPVLCVDMNPGELIKETPASIKTEWNGRRYLLRRVGYPCDGRPNILMTNLSADGTPAWNDPYGWGGRTKPVAHKYIIEHWSELKDGDVVDVEFILGESSTKKLSERVTAPI